jgi:hypothetical protein
MEGKGLGDISPSDFTTDGDKEAVRRRRMRSCQQSTDIELLMETKAQVSCCFAELQTATAQGNVQVKATQALWKQGGRRGAISGTLTNDFLGAGV